MTKKQIKQALLEAAERADGMSLAWPGWFSTRVIPDGEVFNAVSAASNGCIDTVWSAEDAVFLYLLVRESL